MPLSSATRESALATDSPESTLELARAFGQIARPADIFALIGPLGAGKTVFAKGVGEGLGVTSVVNSPTFILMNEHPGRLRLFHIDAYRLTDPDEMLAAGLLDERRSDGVTVIEWADRLGSLLPPDRLDLTIELVPAGDPESRSIRWRPHGARHERLAADLEALSAASA